MERPRGRALKTTISPKEEIIYALEEPYPTECFNHGQLQSQTQRYYMCKSIKPGSNSAAFRVTYETYQRVQVDYSDQYSCYSQEVEKNVCVCQKGFVNYMCSDENYTKCAINVIEPNFAQGCEEREDSFYYLYSVPGFSPCWPQNFNSTINVKFSLNCKTQDENGMVTMREESVGYPYRDVIVEATYNPAMQVTPEPESEFTINDEANDIVVSFDMRDMKYLSHKRSFN